MMKSLRNSPRSASKLDPMALRRGRFALAPFAYAVRTAALVGALWLAFDAGGGAWRSDSAGALFAQSPPKTENRAQKNTKEQNEKAARNSARAPVERLVRIRVVVNLYHPLRPYAAPEIREWVGSGVWLGDGQILTDLRLVRFASVIEYWKPGADPNQSRPTPASILHRGHDCGLAVIGDRDGPAGAKLPAGAIEVFSSQAATVGQELKVFGFASDAGGAERSGYRARGMLVRSFDPSGKIADSDIDRHALYRVEARGDAAALDRGYSGGPAVTAAGGIIGVYIRGPKAGDRPYVLAAGTVRAFLGDLAKDGRYDGFPRTGLHFESLASPAAQRYLGLERAKLKNGVLVRRVDFQSAAWSKVRPGDVLLEANGRPIDFAGRVAVAEGKASVDFSSWLRSLPRAPLKLKLLRNGDPGKSFEATLDLRSGAPASPGPGRARLLDQPPYFMGAGLVFQELEYDLVHALPGADQGRTPRDDAEILHRYFNYYTDRLGEQVDRDVVLTARLPDPVNADADRFVNGIVRSVNGRRIRNIKDFAAEWGYTREAYVVVEFLNRDEPLILDFEATRKAEERIRTRYRVQENGRVR